MLSVKIIVQCFSQRHQIELLKIVNLKCIPSIGMELLIDNDIDIELLNDERTKTRITIATPSPNGVDAIIRNTTYYSNIAEDEFIGSVQHYINSGWELVTDSCGLMNLKGGSDA